ncbi:hypothetical protein [Bradyrhizobium liaoningense]
MSIILRAAGQSADGVQHQQPQLRSASTDFGIAHFEIARCVDAYRRRNPLLAVDDGVKSS